MACRLTQPRRLGQGQHARKEGQGPGPVGWIGRAGWADETGGEITLLDGLYYASVTTTTTGYGDITPVAPGARLAATLIITPARVAFLLLLVGTTVELLTERWREAHRRDHWRRRVHDHYVICGFGVKGRSAARALRDDGPDLEQVVVVEERKEAVNEASAEGCTAVMGNATRRQVLDEAQLRRAQSVIVAPSRDDTAVLITLTARELAPQATIVASAREEEKATCCAKAAPTRRSYLPRTPGACWA